MGYRFHILSERSFNTGISHQVLFEWEDDFSKATGIDIVDLDDMKKHIVSRIAKKMEIIKPISYYPDKDIYLFFVMNIDHLKYTSFYKSNTIPIICDVEEREIPDMIRLVKHLPIYFVTSISLLKRIKETFPMDRGVYTPQSISEKWTGLYKPVSERKIEILQYGRKDPMLHEFAINYCDRHRDCSYMYRSEACHGSEMVIYRNGIITSGGVIDSRNTFMEILFDAKVSLCSTPLASHTRDFGKNIDLLTARWYESLASGANIIANVSEVVEEELQYTCLSECIKKVKCYEDFETAINCSLTKEKLNKNYEILMKNTTRSRAGYIMQKIEEACEK